METEKTGPTLGSRALAGVILVIAAWLLFKVVIGIVSAVAWTLITIVAVVAVIWAVRTLF